MVGTLLAKSTTQNNLNQMSPGDADRKAFEENFRKHQELMDRLIKEAFSGDSMGETSAEMKAMLNNLMNESMDNINDDDVTADTLMEEFRRQFNGGSGGSRLEDLQWEETKDSRILSFTSKNLKEDSFKIDIKDQAITIQSEIEQKRETTGKSGSAQSVSRSSFKQAVSIPDDVDADSAKIDKVGDKIKISFKKLTNSNSKEPLKTSKHNPNVI